MKNEEIGYLDSAKWKMASAFDCFETAEILFENERYVAVINRLYYSAFNAVSALHYLENKEFRSHKKLLGEFNKLYIHKGVFPKEYGVNIYKLQELRQEADYGARHKINKKMVEKYADFTYEFIENIKTYCNNQYQDVFKNIISYDEFLESIRNKNFIHAYEAFCIKKFFAEDEILIDFMKEVVKEHGTNFATLSEAASAITNSERETPDFTAKLLQDTLKTDEYKKAFEAEQGKTTEQENIK